jgi:sodium transport system permease protein
MAMRSFSTQKITIVFNKEVLDNLRDRRALLSSLFYPLLGPLLMILLFTVLGQTYTQQSEKPIQLPISGQEKAPDLIQFLEQNNVIIQPAPLDPEAAVRNGDQDIVLVIMDDYATNFGQGQPATIQLVLDQSRQSAAVNVDRTRRLLLAYSQQIASLRLFVRGINPNITTPITMITRDVSTPQSQAAQLLNIAPYFIVFSVFMGGMYLAIDSTAGERERGSLEPLLINPIKRIELVMGKLGATLVFTLIAVIETLIAFFIVLNLVPFEEFFGVRIALNWLSLVEIFFISVPIMLLAAALQIIIASYTRSYKEAQNYLSFLPLIPALPGLFLAFVPVKSRLWMMIIPTFGQQLLINQILRGETVESNNVIVSSVVTIGIGLILIPIAGWLYEKERIVFGR